MLCKGVEKIMKHYLYVMEEKRQLECITCDVCGKKTLENDVFELQEMQNINFIGGYTSIFGDGIEIDLDICQFCLKERLGDVIYKEIKNEYH